MAQNEKTPATADAAAPTMDTARLPVQAQGLHLPLERDLRRARLRVGLRPHGRGAEEAHPGVLVAADDPAQRQHRGPRRGHHDASAGLGGIGSRGELHRSPDRLQAVQASLPRRPDPGGEPEGEEVPRLRRGPAHRGAQVQPHVHHAHGPGGGRGRPDLPAARDGAGHLRELQERPADRPGEGALRHRPGGQGVPQRDHHQELHLPHLRVRADGDAVLRAPLGRHEVVRALEGEAVPVLPRPRACGRASCASTSTAPTSWPTTPSSPSTSSTSSRSAGRSWRASTTAPTTT